MYKRPRKTRMPCLAMRCERQKKEKSEELTFDKERKSEKKSQSSQYGVPQLSPDRSCQSA
jgi:hypothetical protein